RRACEILASAYMMSVARMRHHVDRHGHGEYEDIVLALLDLHAVGIGKAEPLLGDFSDLVATFTDAVLVIENVALHLQVRPVANFDDPAIAQRGDQRLFHHGHAFAIGALNLHAVLDAHQPFLNLAEFAALRILEEERIAHTQHLAVNLEGALALLILDPE